MQTEIVEKGSPNSKLTFAKDRISIKIGNRHLGYPVEIFSGLMHWMKLVSPPEFTLRGTILISGTKATAELHENSHRILKAKVNYDLATDFFSYKGDTNA